MTAFAKKEDVIEATLEGLAFAREEFALLSGTDDWGLWLGWPEYMVSVAIMQKLRALKPKPNIWPEVAVEILTDDKNIRKGRVDIALDDESDETRVIIETKANVGLPTDFETKEIGADIERIAKILKTQKTGSIEYGISAFVANRYDDTLDKNLKQIVIKSSKLVKEHGLNLAEYKRAIPTDGKWRAYAVALVVW